jgi:hypothetical protein
MNAGLEDPGEHELLGARTTQTRQIEHEASPVTLFSRVASTRHASPVSHSKVGFVGINSPLLLLSKVPISNLRNMDNADDNLVYKWFKAWVAMDGEPLPLFGVKYDDSTTHERRHCLDPI